MTDEKSPRRRDVLRASAAAGLVAVTGVSVGDSSAQQTDEAQSAFSYSLQEGDRFRVRFSPRDPSGNPATETIPGTCLDEESPEYQIFIVRAFRGGIDLGYRGLFAPEQAVVTETPETTTEEETTPEEEETTEEETTPEGETTEETTTEEAAFQEETTTTENETAQETTPEEEITTETTTETAPETTPEAGPLPEIRRGEWYEVTAALRCEDLFQLTLESIEEPETTPDAPETTAEEGETITEETPTEGTTTEETATEEETTPEAETTTEETTTEE